MRGNQEGFPPLRFKNTPSPSDFVIKKHVVFVKNQKRRKFRAPKIFRQKPFKEKGLPLATNPCEFSENMDLSLPPNVDRKHVCSSVAQPSTRSGSNTFFSRLLLIQQASGFHPAKLRVGFEGHHAESCCHKTAW